MAALATFASRGRGEQKAAALQQRTARQHAKYFRKILGGVSLNRAEELKLVAIDTLVPYDKNSRTHSKEQIQKIRKSLKTFGFVNPVLIDKQFNIIAGHGRIQAAKLEKIKEVPCVMVEGLTDEQKKAYIIADNKLALDAGWDKNLLSEELLKLKNSNFDVTATGFEANEINDLFSQVHNKQILEDDFDIDAALKNKPYSLHGDIWQLGHHLLYCGDSTIAESYDFMGNKLANLCVTDPPYNVNYEGKAGKIKNDKMNNNDFYEFLEKTFTNIYNNLKDGSSIYIFHADIEGLNFRLAFKNAKFKLSNVCHWVKNSIIMGRSDYQWKHEPILYGHKNHEDYEEINEAVLYGWKATGAHKWNADRKQTTIWNFDKPQRSELHPTMKPIPLMAYPIQNSSFKKNIVLEPFAGSGSTLIACEQTDRVCYAIEFYEKFCDVIVERYISFLGTDENVYLLRGGKKIKYSDIER